MIQNDPRYPNYGRANYGQLNPDMTAANMQRPRQPQQGQPQSPMVSSLQRAPQQPAPTPPPSGMNKNAVGTFGPKTQIGAANNPFAGIKNRGKTDFGHGGWQGGINTANRMINKIPWAPDAPLGIGRRAKTAGSDYSVQDAGTVLQRGYQNTFGRQASPEEISSQLAGQGLKPGDRWAGKSGLDAILGSLGQSPEAQGLPPSQEQVYHTYPENDDVAGGFNRVDTPMAASLQRPTSSDAQTAYQEYLSEFPEGDPEQPLDFETFSGYYDQLGPAEESPMASAVGGGRRGWENLLLDTQGAHDSPMSFSGFNMERALAGGDPNSVKDAFARAVSTFDIDLRGKSKEEVGQVLGSPEFHQLLAGQGIQSRPIPGSYDQIEVFTKEEGWIPKDIVASAGSPEAQWWWGDVGGDMGADPMMGGFGMGMEDEEEGGAEVNPNQSALLNGLTGGANWKTLLDQLLSQYKNG
jgi:hypothetical protein